MVEREATKFVAIKSEAEVALATEFLGVVKARVKRVEEIRKFFVNPLNEQVKRINTLFKGVSDPLTAIETKVKSAMSSYRWEEEKKAREEEERLRKLQEKKNEKRAEAGKELDLSIKTVERAEQTVTTATGSSTAKKIWKYEVVDINQVPRELLRCEIKHANVMAKIDEGVRDISGLRIYEDFNISVRAK